MTADPRKFEARLMRATQIPTLPMIAMEVTRLVRDPHASVAEVSKMISDDQALTATILRIVNSAFYGFPNEITSVHHAIVILGFNKVRSVVVSATIIPPLNPPDPGGFDVSELWRHSMTTAICSEVLAKHLKPSAADEAFVAGLLHDIGKVIVAGFFQDEFRQILGLCRKRGCVIAEAEEELLGVHHGLFGRWLAERWGFPERLVDAIHFHHAPMGSRRHSDLTSIVHVADILARTIGVGSGGDDFIPIVREDAWEHLRLSAEVLEPIVPDVLQQIGKAKAFYELIRKDGSP